MLRFERLIWNGIWNRVICLCVLTGCIAPVLFFRLGGVFLTVMLVTLRSVCWTGSGDCRGELGTESLGNPGFVSINSVITRWPAHPHNVPTEGKQRNWRPS
jgi:hypothetical protein